MRKNSSYAYGNLIAYIVMVFVNGLAEWLPLNGLTTGEISAMYPTRITPAPYAFMIWGLIYGLLLLFVLYQLSAKGQAHPQVQQIGPWFIISCMLNAAWIIVWHWLYISASVFVMFALLITLIALYLRTRTGLPPHRSAAYWIISVPFSIYLAWISVAAIVNVSVALSKNGWHGFGWSESTWSVILMLFAALLAVWMGKRYRDPYYLLTTVWALIAISQSQQAYPLIVYTALSAAILLSFLALRITLRGIRWEMVA